MAIISETGLLFILSGTCVSIDTGTNTGDILRWSISMCVTIYEQVCCDLKI